MHAKCTTNEQTPLMCFSHQKHLTGEYLKKFWEKIPETACTRIDVGRVKWGNGSLWPA